MCQISKPQETGINSSPVVKNNLVTSHHDDEKEKEEETEPTDSQITQTQNSAPSLYGDLSKGAEDLNIRKEQTELSV